MCMALHAMLVPGNSHAQGWHCRYQISQSLPPIGAFECQQVVGEGWPGAQSKGNTAGSAGSEGSKFTADLMDQFFRDPSMQQLLYKYLPEPMRNQETFEWMLSNPEYRKQLETMMQQQVCALNLSHLISISDRSARKAVGI